MAERGTWRKITRLEKALYRAAMAYIRPKTRNVRVMNGVIRKTEIRSAVTNTVVVAKLMALVERLQETTGKRIFQRGFRKAVALLENGEAAVFAWAPRLKAWLKDPDYIFWLGMTN
ncbi:MAG TPA: hypothetical protein VMW67_01065 [Desulfobacteria bacterium]|nr:hypothetical protein [Desulfobacteria bacterium]